MTVTFDVVPIGTILMGFRFLLAVPLPSCTNTAQLLHGESYPTGKTAEETCGRIDSRIKRYTEEFSRYLTNIYTKRPCLEGCVLQVGSVCWGSSLV